VENYVVRAMLKQFASVFDFMQVLFDEKNPELLRKLSDARLIPSVIMIKEAVDVAVPLNSSTIMEARRGGKSPLSPFGIKAIIDYLVSEIDSRVNNMVNVVAQIIQQAVYDIADAEPKIVAGIIRRVFPKAVADKLKGGIVISDEPPIDRILNIVIGGPKHAEAMQRRYGKVLKKIEAKLTVGLLQGQGIKPIARDIRGVLNKELASGAAMLARTEIQRAAAKAGKELYAHNTDIIKMEIWVATLDYKNPPCLQCARLDGQKFDVGEGPQPVDDTHPGCRCLRAPIVKSWRELGIDIDDAPAGARASVNGAIPGRITFRDWFEDQPDKIKKEILGRGRFDLYKTGKLKFEQFATNKRVLTIKQLKRRYGIK